MKLTRYEDVTIGNEATYTRHVTEKDVELFGELSGDDNPIHFDEEIAKNTIFNGRIVHGMLIASFISTALAKKLPGPGTIYLKQTLNFKRPVRIGDVITVRLKVMEKNDEKQWIKIATTCFNQREEVVLDGQALVTLLRD